MLFLHRVRRMKGMQVIEFRAKSLRWKQAPAIWNRQFRDGLRFETAHGCWDYKWPLLDKIGGLQTAAP